MLNLNYYNQIRVGKPRTNVERVMNHYNISRKEAENLLRKIPLNKLLPPRGTAQG
jgi:hypothetical protein